jgi:urea carboxylase
LLAPELIFHAPAIVAIAGSEATPKINGEARPRNESFAVRLDDRLTFDYMKAGARAYIAVAGGIDVPLILGSRSTYGLGALGGFSGRKLAAGDVLPVGNPKPGARAGRALPGDLAPSYPKSLELRVVTGLYFGRLTDEAAKTFFEDTWTVAPEADRIGYRYRKGRALSFRERKQPFGAGSDPSNIVDAGYPYGSIQVPGGLEPIILHRDAVSGGGYGVIGTVISADMDRIAQMQPNNVARFVEVDMATALKARAEYKGRDRRLRSSLSG